MAIQISCEKGWKSYKHLFVSVKFLLFYNSGEVEPKFQSSFIPKGPVSSGGTLPAAGKGRQRDFVSTVAGLVFTLSLITAVGVFLYTFYLNYSIARMGEELESARASLSVSTINEILRLDARIVSTDELLKKHRVLSSVFDFLESSTPKSVRFTEFSYETTKDGPQLILRGEAESYAALALEADIIGKSQNLENPVFSELELDDKGNVAFLVKAVPSSQTLLYQSLVERSASGPRATTSTSTPRTSTTTAPRN
jgi:hypothetical protein